MTPESKLSEKQNIIIKHSWANSDFGCSLGLAILIIAIGLFIHLIK